MAGRLRVIFALLSPAALVIACSSGGSGSSSSSSSSSSSGSESSTSSSSSSGTGGKSGTSSSASSSSGAGGAEPVAACANASDEAVIEAVDVPSIAGTCAISTIDFNTATLKEPDEFNCIQAGTKGDGGPGLSDGCTTCYNDAAQCGAVHCFAKCYPNTTSQACVACQEQYCIPAFNSCSGLPTGDGGPGDGGGDGG